MARVGKILIYSLLFLTILVIGVYIYFMHLGGLERAVNSRIADLVERRFPLTVRIDEIRGNLITGVVLSGITVRYTDSMYNYVLAEIPELAVGYSLANLWHRNYLFSHLYIDSLHLVLMADSKGEYMLPPLPVPSSGGRPVNFVVNEFHLEKAIVEVKRPNDTLRFTHLSLTAALESDEGLYSADVKHVGFRSNRPDLSLNSASGKVVFSKGNLAVQNVSITSPLGQLKTSGSIDLSDRSGRLDFAARGLLLQRITSLAGPRLNGKVDAGGSIQFDSSGVSGTVNLAGRFLIAQLNQLYLQFRLSGSMLTLDTLYGTVLQNCSLDGKGAIDFGQTPEAYSLDATVRDFNLRQLVSQSFSSDLSGSVHIDGNSFHKADMRLVVDAEFWESSFDDYPVQHARGRAVITTDSIMFAPGFRVDYFENSFEVEGTVAYHADMFLNVKARLDDLDRYRDKLFIDRPAGRGIAHAVLKGKSADPDLQGWFTSDSLWLYGMFADTAGVTFDISRFLTGRHGTVTASFGQGSLWGLPYDSSGATVTLDSTVAVLDSVFVNSAFESAKASGRFDYGMTPYQLVLDTFSFDLLGRQFYNRQAILIDIDSAGFAFKQAAIEDSVAFLALAGQVLFDESMNGELRVGQVPIKPWLHLFGSDLDVDGYLSSMIDLKGTFRSPQISLNGIVDSLTYKGLALGDVSFTNSYRDDHYVIDSLLIRAHPGIYRVKGDLYLDLSFSDVRRRLLDRPMNLHLEAQDRRFDLVTLFMPSVENLRGDLFADIGLTGTPSRPHLEGLAFIRDAALKYFDMADTVFADSAGAVMIDNRIVIDSVQAYVKDFRNRDKRRYADISGSIEVKSLDVLNYDLDVNLPDEFPFRYDLEDISGVVEGELEIKGDTPPQVSGDLDVVSVMYRANFASAGEGSPIMAALSGQNSWDLDINFDITSNYWIKNDNIDAELGGSINVIREKGRYRFIGEMDVLRGSAYFFEKTFRLEPYSKVTFEDTEYPNPRLDIVAHTRIPGVQFAEEDRPRTTELSIHVTGTLEEPEFNTLEGDTTFTREDILPLIVANTYAGKANGSGRFEQRLTELVSSQVARIGSRQLSRIGVETFEIEPGYGGTAELSSTRVTLGRYIGPNLYIFGQSTISGQSGQALGFEYRFNRSLRLEGRRDEEELYHLNLNLHWEF